MNTPVQQPSSLESLTPEQRELLVSGAQRHVGPPSMERLTYFQQKLLQGVREHELETYPDLYGRPPSQ